jgi:hypothetical protein
MMSDLKRPQPYQQHFSVDDLRRLPEDERRAILEAQTRLAEGLYRLDLQLTGFEAFGEEDLQGESLFTEEG